MNSTTDAYSPPEPFPPNPPKQPDITVWSLLVQGYSLALRNWQYVLWAYAINLVFGLLAAVPFTHGLSSILDHSVAAQKIAGTLNLRSLAELSLNLHQANFFPMAVDTAVWLNLLQLLLLFFVFTGTTFVYISAEPPQLSVLLRGGVAYFWRFVRAALLAGCVAGFLLGVLLVARGALLAKPASLYFEGRLFLWVAVSGAVVFLCALLLRLWFDLVEVYVVRNAMDGELRAHRALLPAYRVLVRYFVRIVSSFLLVGLAGVSALALCLWLWKALPANLVWLAALLSQAGLFFLLASRFWQRALEAAFVLAADPPLITTEEFIEVGDDEQLESLVAVAGASGLSEPTLSELLQKLRTEPWAALPESMLRHKSLPLPVPVDVHPAPDPTQLEEKADIEDKPIIVPTLEQHADKFPLGGVSQVSNPPANSEPEGPA